jgi:hypothetical protein
MLFHWHGTTSSIYVYPWSFSGGGYRKMYLANCTWFYIYWLASRKTKTYFCKSFSLDL